ncbi:MAG: thioredoxin domain-containing protein [Oscillospiraceae bacterium]|nr:thioredoxin domain-containing protein [Oscillospiraceae bacterium]
MSENIINVTKQNFDETVMESTIPVMLVFWAIKYPSCQRLLLTIDTLAERYRGKIQFGMIDVDSQIELTSQLGIGGLPCVLVLYNGRLYKNIGGKLPLNHYREIIEQLLAEPEIKKEIKKKKKKKTFFRKDE